MHSQQSQDHKATTPRFDGLTDYYAVLNVPVTATSEEIARVYRERMKSIHPDRRKGEHRHQATEEAKHLNMAFTVLSKPATRRAYDNDRKATVVQEQIMGRYATGLGNAPDHFAILRDEIAQERVSHRRQDDRSATASLLIVFVAIAVAAILMLLLWSIASQIFGSLT